jgi:MoaA/NifB/PqqE/SkfB family radical SAM enzyme
MRSASTLVEDLSLLTLEKAVDLVAGMLSHASDKNLVRLTLLLERIASEPHSKSEARRLRWLVETNHPFKAWMKRLVDECSPTTRRAFIRNVLVGNIFGKAHYREEFERDHGFCPPNLMVISPTQRCNLMCDGCWAGAYTQVRDMPFETLHRIVKEAHDVLHMRLFVITGGEPFVRKDLLDLYEEFNDSWFIIYTNGLLITDKVARRLGQLGNTMPSVSLEGDREMTDARRGKGTYDRLMRVFERLKANGVMYGFSVTATRKNIDYLGSDEWLDLIMGSGCLLGWYFQYIPIGRNPDTNLMPLPEQRNRFRHAVYQQRNSHPIFTVDFWNDGPIVGGCLAGGRMYFHVNTQGDVEPCVFAHFAVDNINDKTLMQALQSDFFKAIRAGIPYDGNELRACMIIDRPDVLRDYCKRHGAHATHDGGQTILNELADNINAYAHGIKELYDPAWTEGDWMRHFPDPPAEYK